MSPQEPLFLHVENLREEQQDALIFIPKDGNDQLVIGFDLVRHPKVLTLHLIHLSHLQKPLIPKKEMLEFEFNESGLVAGNPTGRESFRRRDGDGLSQLPLVRRGLSHSKSIFFSKQ